MTPLQRLARQRIDVLGNRRFGPYARGRYDDATRLLMAQEELADLRAYAVEFDRVERPRRAKARKLVERAAELLWEALELQAASADEAPRPSRTARRRR